LKVQGWVLDLLNEKRFLKRALILKKKFFVDFNSLDNRLSIALFRHPFLEFQDRHALSTRRIQNAYIERIFPLVIYQIKL